MSMNTSMCLYTYDWVSQNVRAMGMSRVPPFFILRANNILHPTLACASVASGTRPERKGDRGPPSPVAGCLLRMAPPGPSREPCTNCGGGCDGRNVRSQRKEVVYLQHSWSWV